MTPEQKAAAKRAANSMRAEVDYDRLKPRAKQNDAKPSGMSSAQPTPQRSTMQNRQGNGPAGIPVGGAAERAASAMKSANDRNQAVLDEVKKIYQSK